jgi:hypothetical protein
VREWPGWGSHGGDERRVDVGLDAMQSDREGNYEGFMYE